MLLMMCCPAKHLNTLPHTPAPGPVEAGVDEPEVGRPFRRPPFR